MGVYVMIPVCLSPEKLSKRDLLNKIQPDRMQALTYISKIITSF